MAKPSRRKGIICVRVTVFILFSFAIIFLYYLPSKKNVVIQGDTKSDMLSSEKKSSVVTEKPIEEFQGALEANKVVEFDITTTTTTKKPVIITTTAKTTERAVETTRLQSTVQVNSNGCPESVLTIGGSGKVANSIWEYLSVYSLAKFLPGNRVPYVPKITIDTLTKIFDNVNLPQLESIPKDCSCNTDWNITNVDLNDFIPLQNVASKFAYKKGNLILSTYTLLLEPILETLNEIKTALKYKEEFMTESTKTLNTVKDLFIKSNQNIIESNITYVGVHIRRTDYLDYVKTRFNLSVVGVEYFEAAIKYFRNRPKFGKPVFLVVSDDMAWAEQNLKGPDIFYASKGGVDYPGHDLALLSRCNHSIIDYGTFGLWGAIYAGGETISVKTTTQLTRILGNKPNWHLVDINKKEDLVNLEQK